MLLKMVRSEDGDWFGEAMTAWQETKRALLPAGLKATLAGVQLGDLESIWIADLWKDEAAFFDQPPQQPPEGEALALPFAGESEVSLWESLFMFGSGLASEPKERVVRVVQFELLPGRQEHFLRSIDEVWQPGMTEAGIAMGGFFAPLGQASNPENQEFLHLGVWDAVTHARFYMERFNRLLAAARPDQDMQMVDSQLIELQRGWSFSQGLGPAGSASQPLALEESFPSPREN